MASPVCVYALRHHLDHPLDKLLRDHGYKLVEDAWVRHGRRTYMHGEDATRAFVTDLCAQLKSQGWKCDGSVLRCFRQDETKEMIEVEPGGSEVDGHFLHLMQDDI
jgi:hypothetical protein